MKSDDILRVNTFGDFTMIWNNRIICGGVKSVDSQFTRLMQILIHSGSQGVSRMQLQNILLGDSKAEDINHLLRSTIHKARKRLERSGIPEDEFIVCKSGTYYWSSGIQVVEDAHEFEELHLRAMRETDPDVRARLLIDAVYCYKGDFLPQQTRLSWVAQEERRYKTIFTSCVENAAAVLRETGNWSDLEALGRYAFSVYPLNEWELLAMEALSAMGQCRKARELYDETVERYQNELGPESSESIAGKLRVFASRIEPPAASPAVVLERLSEPESERNTGYYCSYYVFKSIYQIAVRSIERYGCGAFLAVCSAVLNVTPAGTGDAADCIRTTDGRDEIIRQAACVALSRSDIICQYGRQQWLMLLLNRTEEECRAVMEQINSVIHAEEPGLALEYTVMPAGNS